MSRPQDPNQLAPSHDEPRRRLGLHFWLAFWAVAITNLAAALDATTLSVALPAISESIGGGRVEAFWAGTCYLLACTVTMLLWVPLSDALGRRPVLLVALVIFGAASIVCAVAKNYTVMIVGRTIQGVGGGGVIGLTTVLITDLVPLRDRAGFYALVSIIWAIGSTTGPVIGGACAENGQWRWIFWLNLPIVGIGILGIGFSLKLTRRKDSITAQLRRLDYLGSILFMASVTSFLIPITWGGTQFAWNSWHTLVPLFFGSAGLVADALYQRYVAGTGHYRWALWSGWALTTFGCGLLVLLNVPARTDVAAWMFLSAVSGLGIGLLFPSITLALQASVPQDKISMAATLVLFFRNFGQAVGVAIGGSILDNRVSVELQQLTTMLPPALQGQSVDAVALIVYVRAQPDQTEPHVLALKIALVRSFRVIWATMYGLSGVAMLVHFIVKEYDMNQEHKPEQRLITSAAEKPRTNVNDSLGALPPESVEMEPSVTARVDP
ncbi:hypothetical protein DL765_005745 [Monosporascus sp. GIB2]|nr:hypothetical protein DL765_005745 [Monosporascus sp. GIB2]